MKTKQTLSVCVVHALKSIQKSLVNFRFGLLWILDWIIREIYKYENTKLKKKTPQTIFVKNKDSLMLPVLFCPCVYNVCLLATNEFLSNGRVYSSKV